MPEPSSLLAFAAIALGMALTPGPNMVYLISRSICQGRTAGLISLGGVALGFIFYMLCAACGITAFVIRFCNDARLEADSLSVLTLAGEERPLGTGGHLPQGRR